MTAAALPHRVAPYFAFFAPPIAATALLHAPALALASKGWQPPPAIARSGPPAPRAAGMPRSSSPAAMARRDSQPCACSSWIVGGLPAVRNMRPMVGKRRCAANAQVYLGRHST